eukprot:2850130-Prymnesium_polylepis.1
MPGGSAAHAASPPFCRRAVPARRVGCATAGESQPVRHNRRDTIGESWPVSHGQCVMVGESAAAPKGPRLPTPTEAAQLQVPEGRHGPAVALLRPARSGANT